MAVNYTDLFEDLGEFVQRINDFVALYAALDTDFSEIEAELEGNNRADILSGTYEIFEGYKGSVLTWISGMQSKTQQRLMQRETILEELGLQTIDVRTVLRALYRDMVDNTQTIDASTVTVGAVTADKVNTNAGGLLVDKKLDGVTSPHQSYDANWEYNEVDSELAGTETMWVECTADSSSDGATEGAETFIIMGQVASPSPYHWQNYGTGPGPTLTVLQGASILSNLEMEDFTSNVPASWTLDAGTAGTHVLEETVTVHRGDSALEFTGDAAQASIQVSQAVTTGLFTPRRRYLCGFWIQGQAGTSAGTLTIQFEGTGYTAAASEKIELNAAALAALTSYDFKYFYINWPTEPPDDMELVIKWTGTPSAHSVFIDGGGVAPVVYHNGVNFMVYAGSEEFIRHDRFTLDITNDAAGVFQEFFRKTYGVQMPSNNAGAETIADTLAT